LIRNHEMNVFWGNCGILVPSNYFNSSLSLSNSEYLIFR
jgi:hypothetical protein